MKKSKDLKRTLGFFPLMNIVIANMIGAGIFTTSGLIMGQLQNPILVLMLWLIGGIVALCGALTYGALSAAMPKAGGEYIFLSKLIHPAAGFLSGWTSLFVGFSAPIAASALAFYEYFLRGFPGLSKPEVVNGPLGVLLNGKSIAIGVIILFTIIHSLGLKLGTIVQNILTLIKVSLIAGLIVIGFTFGDGQAVRITQGDLLISSSQEWKSAGLCLLWIMFAYTGWNASSYLGSEANNPQRNIPRSLIAGTAIVMILYMTLNILFSYATPYDEMSGIISIGGLTAGNLLGQFADQAVSILIAFALFSSLSAYIILGPRVYYAMAIDGYFFNSIAEVHPRFGCPHKALIMQSVIAIMMILLGSFEEILTYMGFSLGIFPLLSVIAFFRLWSEAKHSVHVLGFPVTPIFFLIAVVFMLIISFVERPVESSIAILTVMMGIPLYVYFTKTKKSNSNYFVEVEKYDIVKT